MTPGSADAVHSKEAHGAEEGRAARGLSKVFACLEGCYSGEGGQQPVTGRVWQGSCSKRCRFVSVMSTISVRSHSSELGRTASAQLSSAAYLPTHLMSMGCCKMPV